MDKAPQLLRGSPFPAYICVTIALESCSSLLLSFGVGPGLNPLTYGLGEETEAQTREMVGL